MSRIIPEIIERHADEAAFLWEQRDRSARSPVFDLRNLRAFDDRLSANLEGLALAGADGLRLALTALERATRSTEGPDGELFAACCTAVELGDNRGLSGLIAFAQRSRRHERALVSALAWLRGGSVERVLSELLSDECPPELCRLGIAARAARREDPGAALDRALSSDDAALRSVACRAAGRLGRRDLLMVLRRMVVMPDEAARTCAAWAAVLLGDSAGVDVLWATAAEDEVAGPLASDLAARASDAATTSERLAVLASSERTLPAALAGAAARGDPSCLGWVLECIERSPALARRAAWVYATITGAGTEPPLFVRNLTDEPRDEDLARHSSDPHGDLGAPAAAALRAHWHLARLRFQDGKRYLGGRPIEATWLRQCLREGVQPWRAAAAIELLRASGNGYLFPVLAPGSQQLSRLTGAQIYG